MIADIKYEIHKNTKILKYILKAFNDLFLIALRFICQVAMECRISK